MSEYDFMSMATAPPEGAVCDFCSSPDVHWTYPCRDHQRKPEHLTAVVEFPDGRRALQDIDLDAFSSGGWAACNPCHALIERGDRERLARRSAKRMLKLPDAPPISLREATAHCRRMHDQFWSNREGAPIYHERRPTADPTR